MNGPLERRESGAFTLLEVMCAVAIGAMILLLAIPSFSGILAEKRLDENLALFNSLVMEARRTAREAQGPAWLAWEENQIVLVAPEPEASDEDAVEIGEEAEPEERIMAFHLAEDAVVDLKLEATLVDKPRPRWVFWPTGISEPAVVEYRGPEGRWRVRYHPLRAEYEMLEYELPK